ncbi:hypothetical protein BDZ85DRAFT_268768 [Elsinoe ampelina]|uniref:DNA endonuclease activator Ctp1 C-terminal domain-containing protein n=1 Tax=Elsinoe ampelina TaxID=302913 RepID=A0A6A6G0Q5_9PEZI|nr:hypothetical protein BDZ85DRAFT_268768 [Elsinoe ampelina]
MAEDSVPRSQYEELQRQYNALEDDYKALLVHLNKATVKLREAKATCKAWQRYYDTHPKYTRSHQKYTREPVLPSATPPPRASPSSSPVTAVTDMVTLQQSEKSTESSTANLADELRHNDVPRSRDQPALVDENTTEMAMDPISVEPNPSSQSTELGSDDLKDQPDTALEEDDDEPEVISARVIRKPGRRTEVKKEALLTSKDGSSSRPFQIKREDTGTQGLSNVPAFLRLHTQTSDLDALVAHVETPRKRQKIMHLDDDEASRTVRAAKADKPSVLLRAAQDENTPPASSQQSRHSQKSDRSASRDSTGPLQPLGTNTPTLPRTSDLNVKRNGLHHAKKDFKIAQDVANLAEDDTNFLSPDQQNDKNIRRLEGLLQSDSASRNIITPRAMSGSRSPNAVRPTVSPVTATRPRKVQEVAVEKRSLTPATASPVRRKRVSSPVKPAKRMRASHSPPPAPGPEEEPLRAKPLHRLVPDDFRINPLYAGTDFAFGGPLRDHQSRQCVAGCTRPCCAALQHFAGSETPLGRLQARDTTEEDEQLLREHLGHDPATLTSSQRDSLLRSARAQKVANKYGKHKQVFERRQSPPGFWDTEMPSTQDRQAQKKQAKERERQDVEERWREAVRGDGKGRWIFKDELPGKVR